MEGIEGLRARLARHRGELREKYKVKGLELFGSYVRGEQKEKSDLDVLVEFEEPVSLLGLVRVENYLSELLGVKIDLVPKKDLRPELKDRILSEAVAL
jgi:predicted nucleotidyltransferase